MSEQCNATKNDGEKCTYRGKYQDGKCGIHSDHNENSVGRPSDLEEHKDEILEFARDGMSIKDCAGIAGVDESTLHKWLNENEDFSKSFQRARAEGAARLRRTLLEPDEYENPQGARFLLERSHGYIKTEKQEITGEDGGGIIINTVSDDE